MKTILLAFCALAFSAGTFAQQYKWTDKDGRVRYGDVPPPGVKPIPLKPPPAPASAGKAPGYAKQDEAFRKRQQAQREAEQKVEKERADAQSRRVNCEQAQASLRQLESGQRVSSINAQGERVYMEDEQRAQATERARKAAAEWCK
jgi:hypothetical protein